MTKELGEQDLAIINIFETVTGIMPIEWEEIDKAIFFVVPAKLIGKAIGKAGTNVQRLEKKLKKKIMILAHSEDISTFVKNLFKNITIYQVEVSEIMDSKAVTIIAEEKDKKKLIGKEGMRIKGARALLKRLFNSTLHVKTKIAV